ncbi:uncharacterized protein UV8b_00850 [Ustilaginoidea virens]|uniref:Uncharacterized protein n=1 Tax=Ustilaginoidea virens TaxID=1159556 RepID=A0A8E5HJH8_USTVR|nr:uncharacterized protein UV8b_00850 [Ustilaginoidea virens]QUC16609.1 hypothetical protein UV8b_00850 [Ustilaginoidea virens]
MHTLRNSLLVLGLKAALATATDTTRTRTVTTTVITCAASCCHAGSSFNTTLPAPTGFVPPSSTFLSTPRTCSAYGCRGTPSSASTVLASYGTGLPSHPPANTSVGSPTAPSTARDACGPPVRRTSPARHATSYPNSTMPYTPYPSSSPNTSLLTYATRPATQNRSRPYNTAVSTSLAADNSSSVGFTAPLPTLHTSSGSPRATRTPLYESSADAAGVNSTQTRAYLPPPATTLVTTASERLASSSQDLDLPPYGTPTEGPPDYRDPPSYAGYKV